MTPRRRQCAAESDVPHPRHICTCGLPDEHWTTGQPEDVVHRCRWCKCPYTTDGEEKQ